MDVGIGTFTERDFDEAVAATRATLTGRGFDILHEVDLTGLVRDRAGGDVERVRILGARAPGFAAAAYAVNEDVALLLPGNVVVRESGGGCVIEAQNPALPSQVVSGGLQDLADDLAADLRAVMRRLGD